MKKNRFLLMLFTFAVALLGVQCSDDDGISAEEVDGLSLSAVSFDAPVGGDEYTLSITCDDVWSIAVSEEEDTDWVNWVGFTAVSGEGSEEIAITVFENKTVVDRSLTFTVTAGELEDEYDDTILPTKDFVIKQGAGEMSISITEKNSVALLAHTKSVVSDSDDDSDADTDADTDKDKEPSIVDPETNTATFNIFCNDPEGWDLSIPDADKDWLSTLINGNVVVFFVKEYDDKTATTARKSVVTLSCKSNSKVNFDLTIKQNSELLDFPPTLSVAELADDLEGNGGTATLAVTVENNTANWTAKIVDENGEALSSDAWVTIKDGASGPESGDVTIEFNKLLSIESTLRTAYLVVSTAGAEDCKVLLTQTSSKPSIAVAEAAAGVALSGAGSGASKTLNVTANTDWSAEVTEENVTDGVDWLSIESQSVEDGTISIKAADWYTTAGTETRKVNVTVSYTGDYSSESAIVVAVTQTAQKVEPATYSLTLVDENTLSFKVTNTAFAASQAFSTDAYTLAYTNDYGASASASGNLVISTMALDASDSSNATVTITTTDTIYNTDKLSLYMTDTTGADSSIAFTSGATFNNLSDSAALTIEPDYVEYLNCDFETEESYEDWMLATNGQNNPYEGASTDWMKDDGTGSNKALYFNTTDDTTAVLLLSETFAYDPEDGDDFILRFDVMKPSSVLTTGFAITFCTKSSTATNHSWSNWVGVGGGNAGQSIWVNVADLSTPYSWYSKKQSFIDVQQPVDGGEDFDDLRLCGSFAAGNGEMYLDNITFGNAQPRTEAGTGTAN